MPEIWIQLENHAWDVCPSLPMDRMTSAGTLPVGPLKLVALHSPVTGVSRTASVNRPITSDALILRRYTKDWRSPDDRKVNPWDLNEPDPTDAGTMGTIPGPTIECNVGDTLRIHFRNLDMRMTPAAPWDRTADLIPAATRTHSLHAHGVSFPTKYDGAYPLSPPDRDQAIEPSERPFWDGIGVTGPYKQGDRVPPAGSFTYIWEARGPASAGVWIYHDHSICDANVARGALGLIVVHNPADKLNEVGITPERLPGGSWIGSPLVRKSIPVKKGTVGILDQLPQALGPTPGHPDGTQKPALRFGNILIEITEDMGWVKAVSLGTYREPPDQAQFLLVFHELEGVGMCINGRQYLGNTPTLVAGAQTRMRFGVAGMGDAFHTFHIHGHRWVVPGPSGKTPTAIEQSPQTEPTSSFEDTKVFGPGTSFAFTLEEGTGLFRADPPFGEWHMHCHVPMHMMHGMVASLLVVKGGELAMPLPEGQACPPEPVQPEPEQTEPPRAPQTFDVHITNENFIPSHIFILPGDSVRWINDGSRAHGPQSSDGKFKGLALLHTQTHTVLFKNPGAYLYKCVYGDHVHNAGELSPGVFVGIKSIGVVGGGAAGSGSSAPTPSPAPASGGTMHDVSIGAAGFSPSTVSIKSGDSVRWTNNDSSPHTATGDDHSWGSPTLSSGQSFFRPFPSKGTVAYHCHIHHEMTATVVVT
jgi:plastocyanin/FtsP/CotA-like multicopper oxidase with cupredoxin domain